MPYVTFIGFVLVQSLKKKDIRYDVFKLYGDCLAHGMCI